MDVAAVAAEIAERGFALIPGFLTGADLDRAVAGIEDYFPDPEGDTDGSVDIDGFKHAVPFPFAGNALNRLPLDARVIDVAERLLDTEDLLLTSSFVQAKYGTAYGETHDQSLHNDTWAVNSLLPPRTDGAYQRLFGIVYLTDVTADTAPTYVAGRAGDLGVPLITSVRKATYSSTEYPALYERERPVEAPKGSLLLFTGDLVHRGSAYRARHGRRLALFFNIHGAAARWTGKHLWAMLPASPAWGTFQELMVELSPKQRQLLGFPEAGDPYWTADTIGRLTELYPGIDVTPYVAAVRASA
ncbi:phytanoyl-CoA dioxygenase family protein [Streptomyces sp. PSKA30]|uniref:phytanoyl-CoA dioxygenase family protein n=1 Tax=Streptomyces sp. PSKA30 TaxID=2874597 RepID=UPI001CD0E7F8|nr:phytanoyl-CoA dioxygenase family protein [Streptomyces sp. PSKA30]MBZ9644375.1 phytanoyl-CoA dioxygenase family protein [Streptomyces sp. PSKA30]